MGIFDKLFKPNIEEMKAKRDVDGLVKAIKHRDVDIRLGAIFELGEIGDRRAVEPLCEVVSDKKPSYARGAACIALGKIGDARAVKPLISFVKLGSSDPKYATEALAKIGEPSVEPLIEALPICWKKAKQRIAEALGEIGDKRAVEPLIKFLGYSGLYVGHMDNEGRRSIVRALRRIGDKRAIAGLEMACRDSAPIVRVAANEALREVRAGAHT
ncbi:MAG: HEAT repeat domain-containing protein, partial [Candidatus Bathyarchaeota archaeon]|nr:HEAT repeat domain-containing protein [Candidatus Bathyarchaeota archaeon]